MTFRKTYDPEAYRHNCLPRIRIWLEQNPTKDPVESLNILINATGGCPIQVVLEFLVEILGETESLKAAIKSTDAYYRNTAEYLDKSTK